MSLVRRGRRASKADLHCGETAEEPAGKPRVVGENDQLNLGSHKNYIAPWPNGDNERTQTKKGRIAALPNSLERYGLFRGGFRGLLAAMTGALADTRLFATQTA